MNPDDVERKIEEALSTLDGVRRESAGPFFYTRLRAKIDAAQRHPETGGRRRVIMIAVTVMVLAALNVITIARFYSLNDSVRDAQERESFAEEYNLTEDVY